MKKLLYILLIPILGIVVYYVFGTNNQNYEQTIAEDRKQRIHFLLNSSSSPIKDKEKFSHPGFFETNKKYRVNATVEKNPKTEQLAIEMSDGKLETYIRYGEVKFNLEGKELSLVLFQHLERTTDFLLPFGDHSNGSTTYGSGRHLPLQYNGSENLILDFNLAENPFCAYNHNYSCPLPPKSNVLPLAIEVGEKAPSDKSSSF